VTTTPVAESKTEPADLSPTLTGYLRFFALWVDLFKFQGSRSNRTVWILGSGLEQIDGVNHCSQVSEALRFWSHSKIMVFDNNPTVLAALHSMDHAQATPHFSAVFELNTKSKALAEEMEQIEKILEDESPRNNTVTLHPFEIGKDNPKQFPAADFMIATYSMMYPMAKIRKESQDKRIDLLIQYISKLKKGGLLYMDGDCFQNLCEKPGDDSESQAGREEIFKPQRLREVVEKISTRTGINLAVHILEPILGFYEKGRYYVMQKAGCRLVQTTVVVALERAN